MEIYNRRTPGSVAELCFFCWESQEFLENISDMWVNFTLGKKIRNWIRHWQGIPFLQGVLKVFSHCCF